jgi:hypothetical protein
MLARRFYDELSLWAFESPEADDLGSNERLVLLACGWHGPDITAGRRRLCRATGLGNGSVQIALQRLEKRCLMVRVGVGPRGVTKRQITVPGLNTPGGPDVTSTGPVNGPNGPDVTTPGHDDDVTGRDHDVTTTVPGRDHDVTSGRPELERERELPTSSLPTGFRSVASALDAAGFGRGGV